MPRKNKMNQAEELVRLLQLPSDVIIDHVEHVSREDIFFLKLPLPKERSCPLCGSHDCIIRGSAHTQTIRHIPVANRKVSLTFSKRRMNCQECSSSFYETPDWAFSNLRMSINLYGAIFRDLQEIIPFTQIMKKELISERTVRSVFDSIEILHPFILPRTLCIDEFHADSGFWIKKSRRWEKDSYNVNVTDGDRKIVIDVLQQRTLVFLSKHFKSTYTLEQRMRVKFFCCDMNGSFISLAKACFPGAVIIIDIFHVIQLLTRAMDKVRCREQDYFESLNRIDNYKLLKKLSRLFKTWEENFEIYFQDKASAKKKMLEEAFQLSPNLGSPSFLALSSWFIAF